MNLRCGGVQILCAAALVLAMGFVPRSAWAFRVATVKDSAEVLPSAAEGSAPIEELSSGARVYTSDRESNGFYKVKTPSGKIGWIKVSDLQFDGVAESPRSSQAPSQSSSGRRRGGSSGPEKMEIKVFGDMNLFTLSTLNTSYGITQFANGIGFGGEFWYPVNPQVELGIRIEHLSKAVSVEDDSKSPVLTSDVSTQSTPIMVGAQYQFMNHDRLVISGAAMLGVGMGTGVSATATTTATSTVPSVSVTASYSGMPITEFIRLSGAYKVSPNFLLGLELGYRHLDLPAGATITTTSTAKVTGTGSDLNFSGPVVGAGLSYLF